MDHGLEGQGGQDGTDQLDHHVPGDPPPGEVATKREGDAHRGVEVGPGHVPMGRMMTMTIIPGATTAAARPTRGWPLRSSGPRWPPAPGRTCPAAPNTCAATPGTGRRSPGPSGAPAGSAVRNRERLPTTWLGPSGS